MPFKVIITDLVKAVSGAEGAILADWEGEAVDHFCFYDPFELKVTAAHSGIILNYLKDVQSVFQAGNLVEVVLTAKKLYLIIGSVGPDYVMVFTLNKHALLGQALHRFRVAVLQMHKEIY